MDKEHGVYTHNGKREGHKRYNVLSYIIMYKISYKDILYNTGNIVNILQ